jgi:putative transport protein
MLAWLEQFLVRYPELALFLVISAGYRIGSFRFAEFSLGPATGSLFAGIPPRPFAYVPCASLLIAKNSLSFSFSAHSYAQI